MGAQLRIYRRRMRSVKATKKITRAMELISSSRIVKAQQRVRATSPYTLEITNVVNSIAAYSNTEHPLISAVANPRRAAVLIITADRGMAGAYSNAAIKEGDLLISGLKAKGLTVDTYLVGRKAVNFYKFRDRAIAGSWTGFSDNPTLDNAREVSATLITAFLSDTDSAGGVGELYVVYTEFKSMITQTPVSVAFLPLSAPQSDQPRGIMAMYEFESSAETVLNALLPRYVEARVFNALLQSAASEHAARRRAMKSATDNADELIKSLTRLANAARQSWFLSETSPRATYLTP